MTKGWLALKTGAALVAISAVVALLSGCGSTSSTGIGASDIVRVRTIDTVPNGGNAAINVNAGTVAGTQTFFSVTDYRFVPPGAATLSFTLDVNTTTYVSTPVTMSGATSYSVILYGRADVTDPANLRYPSCALLQDAQSATASGTTAVRLIAAGPDALPVDILVNGTVVASNVSYKDVVPYASFPSGTLQVSVVDHASGTVLVAPTAVVAGSGHSMTVILTEPTVKTFTVAPVYTINSAVDF